VTLGEAPLALKKEIFSAFCAGESYFLPRAQKQRGESLFWFREAARDGVVEKRLHLARGFFRKLALLAADLALFSSEFTLLAPQITLLTTDFGLPASCLRLQFADSALQFSNFGLEFAEFLLRSAGAELLYFFADAIEISRHIRHGDFYFFHLLAEGFLLLAESFLLLAEFFLFSLEVLHGREKIEGALDGGFIANDVILAVALEVDEVTRDFMAEPSDVIVVAVARRAESEVVAADINIFFP